jgi:hypothetical protein
VAQAEQEPDAEGGDQRAVHGSAHGAASVHHQAADGDEPAAVGCSPRFGPASGKIPACVRSVSRCSA